MGSRLIQHSCAKYESRGRTYLHIVYIRTAIRRYPYRDSTQLLLPDVLRKPSVDCRPGPWSLRAIHISVAVDRYPFTGRVPRPLLVGVSGDKRSDHVGAGAPDPDAGTPAGVVRPSCFGVDRVEHVIIGNEQAADPAELVVRVEVVPVLIEDLDPVVAPIGHEEAALRVELPRRAVSGTRRDRSRSPPIP